MFRKLREYATRVRNFLTSLSPTAQNLGLDQPTQPRRETIDRIDEPNLHLADGDTCDDPISAGSMMRLLTCDGLDRRTDDAAVPAAERGSVGTGDPRPLQKCWDHHPSWFCLYGRADQEGQSDKRAPVSYRKLRPCHAMEARPQ
ncbi:MAG TPA: hypothetical protein VNQ99_11645 [Xanthobacteraceae bacterium]|nr:hypothetical protein [Xanthobacteraceae bacterium]